MASTAKSLEEHAAQAKPRLRMNWDRLRHAAVFAVIHRSAYFVADL
jgi:hypothetical protein